MHRPTYLLNSWLLGLFVLLAVGLWQGMPERYPVHFDLQGRPNRWAEGPGMWIFLVAMCLLSVGKLHLAQRFLLGNPDLSLINIPHKDLFLRLPKARQVPVLRRANRMVGLVNSGTLLVFISVLLLVYFSAWNPGSPPARAANFALVSVLVLIVAVPLAEAVALHRMIRRKLEEEGLLPAAGGGSGRPVG